MVSTLDFESSDPSSNLGRTSTFWIFFLVIYSLFRQIFWSLKDSLLFLLRSSVPICILRKLLQQFDMLMDWLSVCSSATFALESKPYTLLVFRQLALLWSEHKALTSYSGKLNNFVLKYRKNNQNFKIPVLLWSLPWRIFPASTFTVNIMTTDPIQ